MEDIRFTGEYELSLTDKNRVVIPAPIRKEIQTREISQVYLSAHTDTHLEILPAQTVDSVSAELTKLGRFHSDVIKYQRVFFSSLLLVRPDQQGRILIPETLLDKLAGSEKRLLMLGVGDRLELWRKDAWELHRNSAQAEWNNLGARLTVLSRSK